MLGSIGKYFVSFSIIIASCNPQESETKRQTREEASLLRSDLLTEKLNAAFVIVDGVYNTELTAPYDIFQHTVYHVKPGIAVFTVAPESKPVTTFEGLRIIPDYHFKSEDLPRIDILVVPSAEHSMDTDLKNEDLINFVREKGKAATYAISLCDGAFVLAKAGLVNGKASTTFPSDIARYRRMFPHLKVYEDVSFVHDGKLITSVGGEKSFDAALYLVDLLYGKAKARGVAGGLVINWKLGDIDFVRIDE